MWFSARAVSTNGEVESARHFDRCRDAFDGVRELVDRAVRVVVLDRAADGAGGGRAGDRVRGIFRRGPVAVLEVSRHREGGGGIERRDMGGNLVERRAAIEATEREGEAGARRRERAKAERLKDARRAGVPRVRDHERLARMERGEHRPLSSCLLVATIEHNLATPATGMPLGGGLGALVDRDRPSP
jgi:hypothetical protein